MSTLIVFVVFLICGVLSIVFSVVPRGGHMALARLSLAAICRTILPLVLLLLLEYTTAFSTRHVPYQIILGYLLILGFSAIFGIRHGLRPRNTNDL